MGDCRDHFVRQSLVQRNTGPYSNRPRSVFSGQLRPDKVWQPKFQDKTLITNWQLKKPTPKTPAEWAAAHAPSCPKPTPYLRVNTNMDMGRRRSLVERNKGPSRLSNCVQWSGTARQEKLWQPKFADKSLCNDWRHKKPVPRTPAEWGRQQYQTEAPYVRPPPSGRMAGGLDRIQSPHLKIEKRQPQKFQKQLKAQYKAACKLPGGIPTPSTLLQSQYAEGCQATKLRVPCTYHR